MEQAKVRVVYVGCKGELPLGVESGQCNICGERMATGFWKPCTVKVKKAKIPMKDLYCGT